MSKIKIKITNSMMGLLIFLIMILFILAVGVENFKGDIDIEVTPDNQSEVILEP